MNGGRRRKPHIKAGSNPCGPGRPGHRSRPQGGGGLNGREGLNGRAGGMGHGCVRHAEWGRGWGRWDGVGVSVGRAGSGGGGGGRGGACKDHRRWPPALRTPPSHRRAASALGGGVGRVEGPLLVPLHPRAARRTGIPAPHEISGAWRAEERVAARPQARAARGRHAHHTLGPRPRVGPSRQRAAQPLQIRQHLPAPVSAVNWVYGPIPQL